ncbi:GNAT family N-acetyltransferase, partial [Vibrio cholerae]
MFLRKAELFELDTIYSMGFDVWNGGLSFQEYLVNCQNSKKYQAGTWYVLVDGERIVSSLIVYSGLFGLQEGCFGIGSLVATPELRHRGYGSKLVGLMKAELLN